MANKTFQGRIIQKHDTKANWDKATNFVPLKGEIIVYDDLKKIKIGDGATKVGSLTFINDLDTLAAIAKTGSYNDLKNKPTIPSVGNGTLTIQKNGTSVGTFTANAATDKTINIIVPKKVSELTDDVVKGKYLSLTGGTMTGNLTVGSASLETNGYVTGTWLRTTADTSLGSAASKIAVINNGWIYSRTAGQIKSDIGLGNVDNVKQYSASNPPPYPVKSVNGHTGAITVHEVPTVTASDNGKFLRVVNGAWAATTAPNKFTFTATADQSTFTIPFDFEDSSALTVYYNGIMMKETDNYTVSGKDITLVGFTAEAGDYLTVMGIEGAAAIDYGKEAAEAIKQIQAVKTSAINEINTVKTDTIERINAVVAELPQDLSSIMSTNKTNTMAANSKITMDSTYSPSASGDVATKKYVDDSKPSIVGTSTTYPIYIGSSTPASGTAPLLWIDTTASTGTFKYRTSTTGTWKTVPVAWS